MTATRDLISASISAADELENIYCDEGAALREMCARAIRETQPVSEVPMPDDDNLLCYQQGYAAGVAAGGKDAALLAGGV